MQSQFFPTAVTFSPRATTSGQRLKRGLLQTWIGALLVLPLLLTGASSAAEDAAKETTKPAEKTAAKVGNPLPRVRIDTSHGVIDVVLFAKKAPLSVANFLARVDEGFYKGTVFHRVAANFVIQAGGYDAKLTYRPPPGTVANESSNGLKNKRGTLAMARRADPDSADTQFFINMRDNAHLDPPGPGLAGYSVFGQVVAGMDVAEKIELSDTNIQAGMAGVPEEPIEIISATRLP